MATASRRLSILTTQEIADLYGLPRFTEEDRRLYFDLSPEERAAVDAVHTTSAAVHLTLQLGYFKASRRFFVYTREAVREDLEHIRRRYFLTRDLGDSTVLSKPTRLEQQQTILTLFAYGLCDAAAKAEVEQKAQRAAMLSTQPIFILREALAYLTTQRIVDDPVLRQSVQTALNRGEAYHRLRRAISYVHAGKFRVKTEAEQQLWNECARLIANAIIYYNTLLLSRVSEQKRATDDEEALAILRGISPVAWRHVHLIGAFDFTAASTPVDIAAVAARYNDPDFWRRSLQEGDDEAPEAAPP